MAKEKSYTDQGLRLVNRKDAVNLMGNMLSLFLESPDFADKVRQIMAEPVFHEENPPPLTEEQVESVAETNRTFTVET